MKWMIASDLHGSAYYAQKLWERFAAEGADKLLFLGDMLYHGPRNDLPLEYAPKAVIPLMNDNKECITAVRGNCEAEVDQMVLDFPVMADYAVIESDAGRIFATHGHLPFPQNLQKGDIYLQGHTHIPQCEETEGILRLNPGSLSIPKEDSPHSYMVLEKGHFYWKDIETGETYKEY